MTEDIPTFWWHESHGLIDERGWKVGPSDLKRLAIHPEATKLAPVPDVPIAQSLAEVPTYQLLQECQQRFAAQEQELRARREGRDPELKWSLGSRPEPQ